MRDTASFVEEWLKFEIDPRVDGVSQDAILKDEEQLKEVNETSEKLKKRFMYKIHSWWPEETRFYNMQWRIKSPDSRDGHPTRGLLFGHLAESTLLKGYEPKTCIDVSSEHTPMNYTSRRNSFNADYNDLTTTVAASETPDMKEVERLHHGYFRSEK